VTTIYLLPLLDGGLQVIKSMHDLQKGHVVITKCRGASGVMALCTYN
jgi:hypothetical protein